MTDNTELRAALAALLDTVEPLLDPEVVSAFDSAWEIGPHADGEELHQRLSQAATKARELLLPATQPDHLRRKP